MQRNPPKSNESIHPALLLRVIRKLAGETLDTNGKNYANDIVKLSRTSDGRIHVYTQHDQPAKYHVRDNFFRDFLGLTIENVSGHYEFFVSIEACLENQHIQNALPALAEIESNTQKTLKPALPENYRFETQVSLTENITLYVDDHPVGIVRINNPWSDEISLCRLDIDPDYQHKGYGTVLMDKVIEICLERCANLNITVDPARSTDDDPLIFYSKFFETRHIPFKKDRDHAAIFFECQCTLLISVDDIIRVIHAFETSNSSLTATQFLAMQHFQLSPAQVQSAKFTRLHYLALQHMPYSDIVDTSRCHLQMMVYHGVPDFNLIRDLHPVTLAVLSLLPQSHLAEPDVYKIMHQAGLDSISKNMINALKHISPKLSLVYLRSEAFISLIRRMKLLTAEKLDILTHIKATDILNTDIIERLGDINDDILRIWNHQAMTRFETVSYDNFMFQITAIKAEHVTVGEALAYKKQLDQWVPLLSKKEHELDAETSKQIAKYKKKYFLPEYLNKDRLRLKRYHDFFKSCFADNESAAPKRTKNESDTPPTLKRISASK